MSTIQAKTGASSAVPDPHALLGVGIDTARYGHRATFLRADRQFAAPPLDFCESADGYAQLRAALQRWSTQHPQGRIHVRIDAAGQYAANLEAFLRQLPLTLEISVGEPARNANYRQAHFPKRKSDATDSHAQARFAVVEQPAATRLTPPEFLVLREVMSQLESQVKQTTRLSNQLHNLLSRVFPELATLVPEVKSPWVLALLTRYSTPEKLARAKVSSLTGIPYLTEQRAAKLQQAAASSVACLRGEIAESLVREAVRELTASQAITKKLLQLLQQAFDALPPGPHRLLTTITGIGPATAAAIVAKVVSLDRFATPAQLVSYFGVFPEENTSGVDRRGNPVPTGTMSMSAQGNDLVRRYLWMAAQTATLHNPAIRALFRRQKARGKRGDVALGHCMRKLLHLVFAVWKTGRAFDPKHYPWEGPAASPAAQASSPAPTTTPPAAEMAAGHTEAMPRDRSVVTAATGKLAPAAEEVKPTAPSPRQARPYVDYAALRRQVTMEQALAHLRLLERLKGTNRQLRGACPIHQPQPDPKSSGERCFSVSLDKQVFRCFDDNCSAQGNVLDLWAAVHHLPLYEAALHLAQTFQLQLIQNREEEPVFPPRPTTAASKPPSTSASITPDDH